MKFGSFKIYYGHIGVVYNIILYIYLVGKIGYVREGHMTKRWINISYSYPENYLFTGNGYTFSGSNCQNCFASRLKSGLL